MKYLLKGLLWLIVNTISWLWSLKCVSMQRIESELKHENPKTGIAIMGFIYGFTVMGVIWLFNR